MLRTIFVLTIALAGLGYAFQGPFYGLLFYLWVAYFRPEQWAWSSLIYSLNLSLVSGICVVVGAFASPTRWPSNLRVAMLGLFLLQCLLSLAFAVDVAYAWPFLFEFFKAIVISYVLVALTTDLSRMRMVLWAIALSLGLEAAKQGWAEIVIHPGSPNLNSLPMLGDNNGVAVGMLMLVPILTVLASTAKSRNERWLLRFMALGVLYRGIVTYSRGGFLALGGLALVYILRSRNRLPALAGMVLAALLVVPVLPDAFWQRMSTIKAPQQTDNIQEQSGDESSTASRLHFWNVAMAMAADRPIFGVGYNSFNRAYDQYDDLKGVYGHGRSVHSAWFGLIAELGFPGLFLFIAQLALAFRACWRARAAARLGPEYSNLGQFAFAIEAGLVVFVIGGTFLPFQYTEMVWHAFAISIALDIMARAAFKAVAEGRTGEVGARSEPTPMAVAS
jgi:probable O-glycosylation ligase (exosortase A-associated)